MILLCPIVVVCIMAGGALLLAVLSRRSLEREMERFRKAESDYRAIVAARERAARKAWR